MHRIKLVLLDRDGVINVDRPDSVKSIHEFKLLSDVGRAIRLLNMHKIPVVVITNQAVVGRGQLSENGLHKIHDHMCNLIASDSAEINDIFYCTDTTIEPHQRRKPAPGMLLEAMEKYSIAPQNTLMVGDALRDLQAAENAQCHKMLVKTGKGRVSLSDPDFTKLNNVYVVENILEASEQIIKQSF